MSSKIDRLIDEHLKWESFFKRLVNPLSEHVYVIEKLPLEVNNSLVSKIVAWKNIEDTGVNVMFEGQSIHFTQFSQLITEPLALAIEDELIAQILDHKIIMNPKSNMKEHEKIMQDWKRTSLEKKLEYIGYPEYIKSRDIEKLLDFKQ